MRLSLGSRSGAVFVLWLAVAGGATAHADDPPSALYAELFERVQRERVFPDSKTFADALPREPPATVLAAYRAASLRAGFDLRHFVAEHFTVPAAAATPPNSHTSTDVRTHIDRLWHTLERAPDGPMEGSTRLPLPYRYVVPGGRFTEIYYWDSYFSMLGFEESGRHDLTVTMVDNFAALLDRYGFIPNGTRSYYLSRSQPPFFALMVELAALRDGAPTLAKYLPQLRREYAFWMDGEAQLAPGTAYRRLVRLPDGTFLNRYWDDRALPRDEAYREDVETARSSTRPASVVYRELRAAAESGWDFSSRWLADGKTLGTIHTTDLLPPDLNSLLYQLELTIARACTVVSDGGCVEQMQARAVARKRALGQYLWNDALGAFCDYDFKLQRRSSQLTAASVFPLFVGASSARQARSVAERVSATLLTRGGLATTSVRTGQQWDAPNGWAPLQWVAVRGFTNYGQTQLAATIGVRWIQTNLAVFRSRRKLVEKYDLGTSDAGGGGEYPLQDGFGWTNGVLRALLRLYPPP